MGHQEKTGQVSSSRSVGMGQAGQARKKAEDPYSYAEHWSYGRIIDINFYNYQVRVKLLNEGTHTQLESTWQSLVTQQDDIFLRWGQLRIGMLCKVHWKGRGRAMRGFVEIIGDEQSNMLRQEDKENSVNTKPYKFLGGGLNTF